MLNKYVYYLNFFFRRINFRKLLIIFFLLNPFNGIINFSGELSTSKVKKELDDLIWIYSDQKSKNNKLIWYDNQPSSNEDFVNAISANLTELDIKAFGKMVSINGYPYPEISNYVPNAFVEGQKIGSASLRLISKTRDCTIAGNFSSECSDGILDLDFNIFNRNNYSFNTKLSFQSLTNRGTSFGEGISLGFKSAFKLSSKFFLAFGGDNIIHFDETIDLGRNFYLISSTFHKINSSTNSPILFINAGVGSDFFGYKGNGFLARTTCFGKPNLTGEGTNLCNWGPIASVGLALNDRIAIVNEWFGYSYGTGISFRPFAKENISFSIYATDYINGFPKYKNDVCKNNCETRFYGSINLNF